MASTPNQNPSTEQSPLLGQDASPAERPALNPSQRRFQLYTLSVLMAIVFLVDFGANVFGAPWLRLYESIVCRNFYEKVDTSLIGGNGMVDERYCKVDPVQEELALLVGWQTFVNYFPGLFLAVPFGILADKYGRKWLIAVDLTAVFARFLWVAIVCAFPQVFPIRLIWLQGLTAIFGGGSLVVSALLLVVVSDITLEYQRANIYSILQALMFAAYFFSPPIGSFLMERDLWAPIILGIGLLGLSIPLSLALPETLGAFEVHIAKTASMPNSTDSNDISHPQSAHSSVRSASFCSSTKQTMRMRLYSLLQSLKFIIDDYRVLFLLFASFTYAFHEANDEFFLQYVSKRYGWQLSRTVYLSSLRSGLAVITLTIFIPGASSYLLKYGGYSGLQKDTLLARISYMFFAAGYLLSSMAPTIPWFVLGLVIFTLGAGVAAVTRSMLASLVHKDQVGRLFMAMSLVQTAGALVAAPAEAALMKAGLRAGGEWLGLPFFFVGMVFVLSAAGVWALRFNQRENREE